MTTIGLSNLLTAVTQTLKQAASPSTKPAGSEAGALGSKAKGAAAQKPAPLPPSASTFTRVPMKTGLLGGLGGAAAAALMKPGAQDRAPVSSTSLAIGLSQEVKHEQIKAWVRGAEGAQRPGGFGATTLGGIDDDAGVR